MPPNYQIASVVLNASMEHAEHDGRFTVIGSDLSFEPWGHHKDYVDEALVAHDGTTPFLLGATDAQPIRLLFEDVNSATITFTVNCVPTKESMERARTCGTASTTRRRRSTSPSSRRSRAGSRRWRSG
ncbi:hypothetical protein [Spirillospora sp. CA-128828]|uniref:hypothetical protein n=1 Tax=Spirillospora sp. CA-128828 TaxID=3240033 RepID=UPI003D92FF0F